MPPAPVRERHRCPRGVVVADSLGEGRRPALEGLAPMTVIKQQRIEAGMNVCVGGDMRHGGSSEPTWCGSHTFTGRRWVEHSLPAGLEGEEARPGRVADKRDVDEGAEGGVPRMELGRAMGDDPGDPESMVSMGI